MDFPVKPACYDSVPACLCMQCQLYDVKQMVRAKSATVSSRSPFLPRYAVSLLSRPTIESAPCAVASVLSTQPSSSVAASTYGLADIDAPKYVCEPDCFPHRPNLSHPRVDFADLSSPCFLPGSGSGPAVSPASSAAVPVVQSSCPANSVTVSPVRSSCSVAYVAVSPAVTSSPVTTSHGSPVSSVAASAAATFGPVAAPRRLFPGFCTPFSKTVIRPVFPVARFVLILLPVLLPTPFGLVFSFLPFLR